MTISRTARRIGLTVARDVGSELPYCSVLWVSFFNPQSKRLNVTRIYDMLRHQFLKFHNFIALCILFTLTAHNRNVWLHAFHLPRHKGPLSSTRVAKAIWIVAKRENTKEKYIAVRAGTLSRSAFFGVSLVDTIYVFSSSRYHRQLKRNDDDTKDNYYNKDILDEIFGFIKGTSVPLLPNTKPISIIYPLALSTLSFILPLSTTLLLDVGFALFLYLGRSLAVADQDDDDNDTYQGENSSLFMSDFAALGAAVAFAGLLSPQGFGNGSIISGGGLVAVGATSLLAGFSAVLSAITSSTVSENGTINVRKQSPAKSVQPKDNEIEDSVNDYSERDKEILKEWDEKYNRGPR